MTKKYIKYGILTISVLTIVGLTTTAYAGSKSGHFKFGHLGQKWSEKFGDLGINHDKLKEDVKSGQSFEEALDSQNINKEDLMTRKKELMKEKMAEKVTAGTITQEEADKFLEKIENHSFDKKGSKFRHYGTKGHFYKKGWHK